MPSRSTLSSPLNSCLRGESLYSIRRPSGINLPHGRVSTLSRICPNALMGSQMSKSFEKSSQARRCFLLTPCPIVDLHHSHEKKFDRPAPTGPYCDVDSPIRDNCATHIPASLCMNRGTAFTIGSTQGMTVFPHRLTDGRMHSRSAKTLRGRLNTLYRIKKTSNIIRRKDDDDIEIGRTWC